MDTDKQIATPTRFAVLTSYADDSADVERPQAGLNVRDVLHVVFKRRWLIGCFFLCAVPVVILASLMIGAPKFLARSQLLLIPVREDVSSVRGEPAGMEQVARVSELLTGRILAEQAVKQIGPRELYRDWHDNRVTRLFPLWREPLGSQMELDVAVARFLNSIVVEPAWRSSIIDVGFKHEDPAMAARAVNTLNELFIERYLGVQRNPKAAALFGEQFDRVKAMLRESEDRLQALRQKHGVATSIPEEIQRVESQLIAARSALAETRKQQAELASRLAEVRSQLRDTASNAREVNIVRDKLAAQELEEQEMSIRMKPDNPTLRAARENMRMTRERLAQLEASKSFGTSSTDMHGAIQQEMLHHVATQKGLQVREQAEVARARELEERLNGLREANVEYGRLQQQVQFNEQNYRMYQSKFEELRIANAMETERIASVRVIEPAEVPSLPLPSKKRLVFAVGTVLSLVGGIVLAFVAQRLAGAIDTAQDVERHLGLPVLASIPKIAGQPVIRLAARR